MHLRCHSVLKFSAFARHWLPTYRTHSHPAFLFLAFVFKLGIFTTWGIKIIIIIIIITQQRMHSSAACASCAMSTADKSNYSAAGTLHPYHISPLTHWSLTITFTITLTLFTIQSHYNRWLVFYRLKCSRRTSRKDVF